MAQLEKLIEKLCRVPTPSDLRWNELVSILEHYGFTQENNDGSRRRFLHPATGQIISLHKPHPQPEVKKYVIRQVLEQLTAGGFLQGSAK